MVPPSSSQSPVDDDRASVLPVLFSEPRSVTAPPLRVKFGTFRLAVLNEPSSSSVPPLTLIEPMLDQLLASVSIEPGPTASVPLLDQPAVLIVSDAPLMT